MQYAHYISETEIQYPTDAEFAGIPNWRQHDAKQREKEYLPLVGTPEEREGYEAEPAMFRLVSQTGTKIVPYEVEITDYDEDGNQTGTHREWQERETEIDLSFIEITEWEYTAIPTPEPEPLPTCFSKGTLLEALQGCNLYEQAKAIYANDLDLQIAWAGFADIDLQYQATRDIMSKYPELFSEQNVQTLLEWIQSHA